MKPLLTALLVIALSCSAHKSTATNIQQILNGSIYIPTENGTLVQVYPPENVSTTDSCPDSAWKRWRLHHPSPNFEPLQWTRSEWRQYLTRYPARSAGLSLALLLLGLIA
ncbi:hypothetical protein Agub_g2651, partial [Astrephomene gubernaculifera]